MRTVPLNLGTLGDMSESGFLLKALGRRRESPEDHDDAAALDHRPRDGQRGRGGPLPGPHGTP